MKTMMKITFLLATLNGYSIAQDSLTFWRGVYLFDRDSIDSYQLHDTLGLNLLQFRSGDNTPSEDSVLKNGAGLKVIDQRLILNYWSSGQHMEFEGENAALSTKSHFADRIGAISLRDPAAWWCLPNSDPAGYMVQTAVPDSEYNYDETTYWATFLIKLGAYSGTHPAVTCYVWCKTTDEDLASTTLHSRLNCRRPQLSGSWCTTCRDRRS